MMNIYVIKYIKNTLKHSELPMLKKHLDEVSDSDISQYMDDMWKDYSDEYGNPETLSRMKRRIDARIEPQAEVTAPKHALLFKYFDRVAAVLLPILVLSSIFLYRKAYSVDTNDVVVTTGRGQSATISLSDGTKVMLSHDSRLVYNPATYNKDKRVVQFLGEAYFEVSKSKECPFVVNNQAFDVKVLGTKFGLQTRPYRDAAFLALDEGCVLLTSAKTNKAEQVSPGEIAELCYSTGAIRLRKQAEVGNIKAWMNNELNFVEEPFLSVVQTVEHTYGVKIRIEGKVPTENFNGTVPADNLRETLHIFQVVYGFKSMINRNEITMTR